MGEFASSTTPRPGRKFKTSANDLTAYAPVPRELVVALRAMISSKYGTLANFHRAFEAAGHTLSYRELSRQLNPSRFPSGPDERWALAIADLCAPTERERIRALCRAAAAERLSPGTTDTSPGLNTEKSAAIAEAAGPAATAHPPGATSATPARGFLGQLPRKAALVTVLLLVVTSAVVAIVLIPFGGHDPVEFEVGTCSISSDAPVVIAASGRQNSPAPAVPERVREIVQSVVTAAPLSTAGPPIGLVNVDGQPTVTHSATFRSEAKTHSDLDFERGLFLSAFDGSIASLRAQEPEVDVLAALKIAARLTERSGGADGTIALIDSGLSTTAPLDFASPGMLDAPVDEVISYLRSQGAIPNLTRLTVVLIGIGDVAPPQEPLDHARRISLIKLWATIAKEGGAKCVEVVDITRQGAAPFGTPPVKFVPIPLPPAFPGDPIVLPDDAAIDFMPDRAEFRDPQAARTVLAPIADYLSDHSRGVILTGTTARVSSRENQLALSLDRAEAVRNVLVSLGVPADQIEVRGVGSYFPEYVLDRGPDGELLPGPAQVNRGVRLTLPRE